jgi:hypothetical protein
MPAFHWLCFSPWAFQPSSSFVPNLIKGAVRKVKSLASYYVFLNFQQANFHKKQNICKIFGQQISLISKKSKKFVSKSTSKWSKRKKMAFFENKKSESFGNLGFMNLQ